MRIIRDESYLGKVIFGRRSRAVIGDWHCTKVRRSEWIVVDDMHESIVTPEEFDRAWASLANYQERNAKKTEKSILREKVRCGVCGHGMIRVENKEPVFRCRTPYVTSQYACSKETVPEQDILDVLLVELRKRAAAAVEMSRILEAQQKKQNTDGCDTRKALAKLREEVVQCEQKIRGLYEPFVMGEISKDEYLAAKSAAIKQKDNAVGEIARLETVLCEISARGDAQNRFISGFQKCYEVEAITADIVAELLNEVLVCPNHRFEIKWNYQDEFEKLLLEIGGK